MVLQAWSWLCHSNRTNMGSFATPDNHQQILADLSYKGLDIIGFFVCLNGKFQESVLIMKKEVPELSPIFYHIDHNVSCVLLNSLPLKSTLMSLTFALRDFWNFSEKA